MIGARGSCPSCGAEILFRHGASLIAVCGHCGSAVAKKGAALEDYGKVASLLPTASVLKLGIRGRTGPEGGDNQAFLLVGRVQLGHGKGGWDEWHLALDNGSSAWLAESQGRFHLLRAAPVPPLPKFTELSPGQVVDLGATGSFVVAELATGKFERAEGELPFAAHPGEKLNYADLSGPRQSFGTIDYDDHGEAVALWVGREMTLAHLGIAASDLVPENERHGGAVASASIACTQCGGPLEIRAPDQSRRIGCPWCGSLLDVADRYAVLEAATSVALTPSIPLGSRGKFKGVEFCAIGAMERSVRVDGVRYPWREYLLYDPTTGFRWLTESGGHWSLVEPLSPGDLPAGRGKLGGGFVAGASLTLDGTKFKHFQSGSAQVDAVLGEFYWEVARGEITETHDYVAPPLTLSVERSEGEINFSRSIYMEPTAVWHAFGLKPPPPTAFGVAPNQPWPRAEVQRGVNRLAALFSGILVVLFVAFRVLGSSPILSETLGITGVGGAEAPESAVYTKPFTLRQRGNVAIEVATQIDNSWLYFEGALIDEARSRFYPFDLEVSYYHGSDSDGSWSEGGRSRTRYLGSIGPGTYVLRLSPKFEGRPPIQTCRLTVRSRVPRVGQFLLALLAVLAWPLGLLWSWFHFERRRWAESDHPWGESE